MWIGRTAEEQAQWHATAKKEARSHGWMIALGAWALAVILLSFGWTVSFSAGIATHRSFGGPFWLRLLIFGVVCSPIICIARRSESRRELETDLARTICPKCDTAGESNSGNECQCGGSFVPVSTVKWVE